MYRITSVIIYRDISLFIKIKVLTRQRSGQIFGPNKLKFRMDVPFIMQARNEV